MGKSYALQLRRSPQAFLEGSNACQAVPDEPVSATHGSLGVFRVAELGWAPDWLPEECCSTHLIPEPGGEFKANCNVELSKWANDYQQYNSHHEQRRHFIGNSVKTGRSRISICLKLLAPFGERHVEYTQQNHTERLGVEPVV